MNNSNNNSSNLLEPPSAHDRMMPTRSRNKSPNSTVKTNAQANSGNPKKRKLDEIKVEAKDRIEEVVVNQDMGELQLGGDSQEEVKLLVPRKQNSQKSYNKSKRRKVNNNDGEQQGESSDEHQILLHLEGSLQVPKLHQVSEDRLRILMEESEKVLQDQAFFDVQNNNLSDQFMNEAILEQVVHEPQDYLCQVKYLDSQKIVKDEALFIPSYDKLPLAQIKDEEISCNQAIFLRQQPDGNSRLVWNILRLGNLIDSSKFVISPVFTLQDETQWQLVFRPKVQLIDEKQEINLSSQFQIRAVSNPREVKLKTMKRRIYFTLSVNSKLDGSFVGNKTWQQYASFTDDQADFTIAKFFTIKYELQQKLDHPNQLLIQLLIKPEVYFEPLVIDEAGKETRLKNSRRNKAIQNTYNGLVNEGTTCYLNSLLQSLFFIRAFRRAVYQMPTNIDDFKSIPFCIQRIFYNLQTGKRPVRTFELLNAFGWSQREMNQQHDVNEFFLVLSDKLEKQMQGTEVSGTYANLFEGTFENVIQCMHVEYESSRKEKFNCIQLSLPDNQEPCTIEESLRSYVQAEELTGDNQYDAANYGKQDARKFIRFRKLPPVLQIQVNRFAYDFQADQMMKINSQFKFSETLDIDSILPEETNLSQPQIVQSQRSSGGNNAKSKSTYHLHSILIHRGTLGAGHYFAFIKPSIDSQWLEFNDSTVTPIVKQTALSIGGGGFESFFEYKDGLLYEKQRSNYTSAYMLVYIRDCDREEILDEVPISEIPQHLKVRFDEENQINYKLEEDQSLLQDSLTVNIVSFDTIKSWDENGLMQIPDDVYLTPKFSENEEQRFQFKFDKRKKISEMLAKFRRNRQLFPISELNIYRVAFQRKDQIYKFSLITPDQYNQDVFGKKGSNATFFICSNVDPRLPILQQYSQEEKKIRDQKCQNIIDFVKRRDLNRDFLKTYQKRINEIWKFTSQNIGNQSPSNHELSVIDEEEEMGFQNNNEMISNNQEYQDEGTLELRNGADNNNNDIEMMINTASNNNQQKVPAAAASVLFFIKRFNKYIDAKSHQEVNDLVILMPILLEKTMTFMEAKKVIIRQLRIVEPDFDFQNYELVIEEPCYSVDSDSYDFLDAARNDDTDQDIARSFTAMKNTEHVCVGALEDASILILVRKEDMEPLNFFINEKSHEVYLYLKERDGIKVGEEYYDIKFKFSYLDNLHQIYRRVQQYANECTPGRQLRLDHIQLYKLDQNGDMKVPYDAQRLTLSDLLGGEHCLNFEELAYPLKDLATKEVVKVQHYLLNGTSGEEYVELVDKDFKMWNLIKQLMDSHLNAINEGNDQLGVANYLFVSLDHCKESIIRLINHTETIKDVLSELRSKNFKIGLFQISLQERNLMQGNQEPPGLIFCKLVNQYTRVLFHPFLIILPKNALIEQVREAIIDKLYSMHITYKYGSEEVDSDEGGHKKKDIQNEVQFEQKTNMLIYTLEYKMSRRTTNFGDFLMHELPKGEDMLCYKQGSNYINLGIELCLDYKDDREKRNNNALKIYSD